MTEECRPRDRRVFHLIVRAASLQLDGVAGGITNVATCYVLPQDVRQVHIAGNFRSVGRGGHGTSACAYACACDCGCGSADGGVLGIPLSLQFLTGKGKGAP